MLAGTPKVLSGNNSKVHSSLTYTSRTSVIYLFIIEPVFLILSCLEELRRLFHVKSVVRTALLYIDSDKMPSPCWISKKQPS